MRSIRSKHNAIIRMGFLAVSLWVSGAFSAQAQVMLPGAAPEEEAPTAQPAAPAKPAPRKAAPVVVRTIDEKQILDQGLLLNGRDGLIVVAQSPEGYYLSKLSLKGAQISHPDDACQVDLANGEPVKLQSLGKPQGSPRYQLDFAACPFQFDILDGAILVAPGMQACEMKTADCRVDPQGLWGMRMSAVAVSRANEFEHERTLAEEVMRANFRVLINHAKGKAETTAIASDQVNFPSRRSEICRNYAREDVFGYCALRVTQARGLALRVANGSSAIALVHKHVAKPKPAANIPATAPATVAAPPEGAF